MSETDIIDALGDMRNTLLRGREIITLIRIDGLLSRSITEIMELRCRRNNLLRSNNAFEQRARLAEGINRENSKEIDRLTKKVIELVTDSSPPDTKDNPLKLHPASEWHEDMGDVLWWRLPITEPPYVGTPNDVGFQVEVHVRLYGNHDSAAPTDADSQNRFVGGWPGYHTHFSILPQVSI